MPAQFLTASALNAALERILRDAKAQLILISPYIKLHDRLQALLKDRLTDDKLFIQVVFGKNEDNPEKSMSRAELDFFMQFPNIEIKYEKRLHAKYYTNDNEGLITSMNLYSYSQDNNIESGILTSVSSLGSIANQITRSESLDEQALNYFDGVVAQATPIYRKEPEYEKVMFGLSKKYLGSKVTTDHIADFFSAKPLVPRTRPSTPPVPQPAPPPVSRAPVHPVPAPPPPQYAAPLAGAHGYCIRTGVPIPFNLERPLGYEAYKSWSKFSNRDYPEKFCHFSGEPSNGNTCFAKPILKKNWSNAKAVHNL